VCSEIVCEGVNKNSTIETIIRHPASRAILKNFFVFPAGNPISLKRLINSPAYPKLKYRHRATGRIKETWGSGACNKKYEIYMTKILE
jgi:hypothetical protein